MPHQQSYLKHLKFKWIGAKILINFLFLFQDIIGFRGSLGELENLNEAGRAKLSALRKYIGQLDDWANDEGDPNIGKEVELHRQQLSR